MQSSKEGRDRTKYKKINCKHQKRHHWQRTTKTFSKRNKNQQDKTKT